MADRKHYNFNNDEDKIVTLHIEEYLELLKAEKKQIHNIRRQAYHQTTNCKSLDIQHIEEIK